MVAIAALVTAIAITSERVAFVLSVFGDEIFLIENSCLIKLETGIVFPG
jgi:hypothetical protein